MEFFNVTHTEDVLKMAGRFQPVPEETVPLAEAGGRVLAEDITADTDLPDFSRSTMDGYAVRANSTFGASEGNPAWLSVIGSVAMGEIPRMTVGPGQAVKITTGGMLPQGSDAVVMVEHTTAVDDKNLEVYKSVAPGHNAIDKGEDYQKGQAVLKKGRYLRAQEVGLLAAVGRTSVAVFRKPVVAIISTGDEIVPVDQVPKLGQIRDTNSHTLSVFIAGQGGVPMVCGIVPDRFETLYAVCQKAVAQADMVLISGGSSVGTRDYTVGVLSKLPDTRILVHGISISPGKPTILADAGGIPVWGLPGHVVSAMVVYTVIVKPFLRRIGGHADPEASAVSVPARLNRNLASSQGRVDYVRVRLLEENGELVAEPVLGKSGLIHTMVKADGLIAIDRNTEGLNEGDTVSVIPLG